MSKLEKCPVCDGRGFVKGNFYDVAGQTCSFGDYANDIRNDTEHFKKIGHLDLSKIIIDKLKELKGGETDA